MSGTDSELAAAVQRMLRVCRLVRRLSSSYTPEWVYQVPAVLLLTEDAPGQAFLGVARERWVLVLSMNVLLAANMLLALTAHNSSTLSVCTSNLLNTPAAVCPC